MEMAPRKSESVFTRRTFFRKLSLGLPFLLLPGLQHGSDSTPVRPSPHATGKPVESLPDELRRWQSRPRIPVQYPHDGNNALFLEAIRRKETLRGSHHNKIRRITPIMLFAVGPLDDDDHADGRYTATYENGDPVGPYYMQAWDHDCAAERTYKADAFAPMPTAPWMRPHFNCRTDADWTRIHTQCIDGLREEDALA